MCLGEVLQLVEVAGDLAVGRRDRSLVDLSLLTLEQPVVPGDWVVAHSGFALERLDPQEAAAALAVRQPPSDPIPITEEQP